MDGAQLQTDLAYSMLTDAKIDILAILDRWFLSGPNVGISDYLLRLDQVCKRYPLIKNIEVWNEPDLVEFRPQWWNSSHYYTTMTLIENLGQMCNYAIKTIHNNGRKAVSPPFAGNPSTAAGYNNQLYEEMQKYNERFDAIAVHAYGDTLYWRMVIDSFHKWKKPIWATEFNQAQNGLLAPVSYWRSTFPVIQNMFDRSYFFFWKEMGGTEGYSTLLTLDLRPTQLYEYLAQK